jgi:hypothetical protein
MMLGRWPDALYGIPVILHDWLPTDQIYLMDGRIFMASPAAHRREAMTKLLVRVRPARRRAALKRENARHPRTHRSRP